MADPVSAAPVVLKKYGNRRVYDTRQSRYVTLDEVAVMVQRGADVQVLDAKTGADLTKEILVQIILEREGARDVLPISLLQQVVRVAGSPMREGLTRALQQTIDGFTQTLLQSQRALVDAQRAMLTQAPHLWNPFAPFTPPAPPPLGVAEPRAEAKDQEIGKLRAEMEETQALLRALLADKNGKAGKKRRAAR